MDHDIMNKKYNIPLCKAFLDGNELSAIKEVLESGWFTHGPKNKEFEALLCNLIKVKHAISLNSCTSALHLALEANNIRGEVILPSFTFVASANSIVTAGATPVFADIEFSSCNINPDSIENLIGPRTEALMPIHFAGQCCKMDIISQIAEKHNLLLIEDSAQTLGACYLGKQAGSFGIGCFSFFPTKLITTGEGGALTTDSDELAEKARALSGHGIVSRPDEREKMKTPWYRAADYAGYNFRMSNMLAAMGVEQLKKLKKIIKLRKAHAEFFNGALDPELLHLPTKGENASHVYQMYTVKVHKGIDRNVFVHQLREKGISASVHYDPPVHLQPFYRERFKRDNLTTTEDVASRIVTLPMYPDMREDELVYTADTANNLAKNLTC